MQTTKNKCKKKVSPRKTPVWGVDAGGHAARERPPASAAAERVRTAGGAHVSRSARWWAVFLRLGGGASRLRGEMRRYMV